MSLLIFLPIGPSDERLRELLHGYARDNLSLDDRLLYLRQQEKFNIGYVHLIQAILRVQRT